MLAFAQYIEAQNCQHLEYGTSDAKSVTMSFWIKTSVTGTYCFFLQNSDGDRIQVKEYTVNSADTWEKKIITIPGDASGTINNDNGRGLWCGWVLMAGTDRHGSKDAWRTTGADYATSSQVNAVHSTANNIYITGVQLEVGDTATPFEHLTYAEEFLTCQRYFRAAEYYTAGMLPWANSGGGFGGQVFIHPVEMRATPTITQTAVPSFSNILGASGPQSQNTYSTSVNVNAAGDKNSFKLQNNHSGSTIYAVSSGLKFNAEL
jgi:hypothetical protein